MANAFIKQGGCYSLCYIIQLSKTNELKRNIYTTFTQKHESIDKAVSRIWILHVWR